MNSIFDPHGTASRVSGELYRRDAVPLGPFAVEPLDLWRLIGTGSGGVVLAAGAWLIGALYATGVDVRAFDRVAAQRLAAHCGVPQVQAIAGWIARARPVDPGLPPASPDHRRPPAERLLEALHVAGVALGSYDARLPGRLVDDCGPSSAWTVAGWLGRVGRRGLRRADRGGEPLH